MNNIFILAKFEKHRIMYIFEEIAMYCWQRYQSFVSFLRFFLSPEYFSVKRDYEMKCITHAI